MSSPPDSPPADEIRRLEERAARDPKTHTFARLADLYRKSGKLERALEVVEEGLAHHPHYLNARLVRARVLRELGRADEAAAAFRLVLEIDEENLVALEALESLGPAEQLRVSRPSEGAERVSTSGWWLARLEADWRTRPVGPPARNEAPASSEVPVSDEVPASDEVSVSDVGSGGAGSGPDAAPDEAPVSSAGSRDAPPPESPERDPAREPASSEAEEPRAAEVPTATLASLYLSQGLYDEAIGVFEKLLARDPYNARLAQGLEQARRHHRRGSRPAARAPEPVTEGEKAPPSPDGAESFSRAAEGGRATGQTGDATIREFLRSLLEGRAEVPDETPEGWRMRLERWLGGEGNDSSGG